MLISIKVNNYLSYKEETELSLQCANRKEPHKENSVDVGNGVELLRSLGIFGLNSSGKSNILKALVGLSCLINGSRDCIDILIKPFKYSFDDNNEISMEIKFLIGEKIYRYGFKIFNRVVVEEWLLVASLGLEKLKEANIFHRQYSQIKVNKKKYRETAKLNDNIKQDELSLARMINNKGRTGISIEKWFNSLIFSRVAFMPDAPLNFTDIMLEPRTRNEVLRIMAFLNNSKFEFVDRSQEGIAVYYPKPQLKIKQKTLQSPLDRYIFLDRFPNNDKNEKPVRFNLDIEESSGFVYLLNLSAGIYEALHNGKILIVDEFGIHLHTILKRKIISMFHSNEWNVKNGQLIFASHDLNLLDNSLFRRDQIWFTERNSDNSTNLFSLVSKEPRLHLDYMKRYLNGEYGAI